MLCRGINVTKGGGKETITAQYVLVPNLSMMFFFAVHHVNRQRIELMCKLVYVDMCL